MLKTKVILDNEEKGTEDPLNEFVEHHDILELLNGMDSKMELKRGGRTFSLLDESPPAKGHPPATGEDFEIWEVFAHRILNQYGKGFTQTLSDVVLDTYTEGFIMKTLYNVVGRYSNSHIIVPEYSPRDGRLHFHGIITVRHIRDISKMKRMLKPFGFTKIDMSPLEQTVEYLFKEYKKNKFTPEKWVILPLPTKYVSMKRGTDRV